MADNRATGADPPDNPGRDAARPARFAWADWQAIMGRTFAGIGRHHISITAAGVAFFSLLATFPATAALIALYGFVADPTEIAASMATLEPVLPEDVYAIIEGQVSLLAEAGRTRLGLASLVSLLFALWLARAGVNALIESLNIVYREPDGRNIVVQNLLSMALTLLFIGVAIVALVAVVAVPAVLSFLDLGLLGRLLAQLAPLVVLGIAVVFVIGALYRFGPNRSSARKRWITVGAVVATVGWLLASLALSVYFSRFADFNQTYGSLGAFAGLMLWLYASAFVVLLGAELNAEMELQTRRDTTTGKPRPMGKRGAYVADHVAH